MVWYVRVCSVFFGAKGEGCVWMKIPELFDFCGPPTGMLCVIFIMGLRRETN